MIRFSFTHPVLLQYLQNLSVVLPGVQKAIAIFFDADSSSIKAFQLERETLTNVDLDFPGLSIPKERAKSTPFFWLNSENIFFTVKSSGTRQLNINDEMDKFVLRLQIPNMYDKQFDILILYLDKKMGLFQMSGTKNDFSQDNKNIIGKLIYNTLLFVSNQARKDLQIFETIREGQQQTINQYSRIDEMLNKTRDNYAQSLVEFCKQKLSAISTAENVSLVLSEKAVARIAEFTGRFENLERVITKAAVSAINRNFDTRGKAIEVLDLDIVFPNYIPEEEKESPLTERHNKTVYFLDRYELAARKVLDSNESLTGANLGKLCSPSVSAAAITDSLKKYKNSIYTVLNKYPDKWPIIRSRFKPVLNIVSSVEKNRMAG